VQASSEVRVMPNRTCRQCHAPVQRAPVVLRHDVDGIVFTAEASGRPCASCGFDNVDEDTRGRFALLVASQLARPNGAAVKFIREALGFRATELVALLDVSLETLSRWENDRVKIPRAAHALLVALVRDALEGTRRTLDVLRRLRSSERPPRRVSLSLAGRRRRFA
jgi:DNA-binding transcriptional regulator YiaG